MNGKAHKITGISAGKIQMYNRGERKSGDV
jgi:hypothetical protein